MARRTGLTRAAARRFLLTLQTIGYVGSDGRYFSLRPRVLDLGYAYLASLSLTDVVQDHLARAAEELHESCSAAVLDGDHIVYVARASTKRIMAINLTVGTRLPAASTSMGRVLLAALPPRELDRRLAEIELPAYTDRTIVDRATLGQELGRVREQGWCLVDQELEIGVRACALPIHDADGRVIAAINASAHASRVTLAAFKKTFQPRLRDAGRAIEADLRARR